VHSSRKTYITAHMPGNTNTAIRAVIKTEPNHCWNSH